MAPRLFSFPALTHIDTTAYIGFIDCDLPTANRIDGRALAPPHRDVHTPNSYPRRDHPMHTQTYEGAYARLTPRDLAELLAKLMAMAAKELAAHPQR